MHNNLEKVLFEGTGECSVCEWQEKNGIESDRIGYDNQFDKTDL